jgi:hypothetical protein
MGKQVTVVTGLEYYIPGKEVAVKVTRVTPDIILVRNLGCSEEYVLKPKDFVDAECIGMDKGYIIYTVDTTDLERPATYELR